MLLHCLKSYFGYDSFRPMQKEIIDHILQKKDCLVLMPTGGGKSICFQIPALMMEGTAIVVSPLISLMKDQVEALRANGIAAAALNSNASEAESRTIAEKALRGEYKLLYVSPEKLLSEIEYGVLRHSVGAEPASGLKVSLIAIDEAHCISSWGHDFRPEYTQLGKLRTLFPDVPIAAFTATADKITKNDIVEQLQLRTDEADEVKVFVNSFDRPNLSLDVRRGYSAKDKLRLLLSMISRHSADSGIVYCLSRKTTEKVASDLCEKGVKAKAYHAGLSARERDAVQEDFINDRIQVVCATIAFGMGIDKSNVRFVVHYNLPKSIENYYQEIGRGGRDGLSCETLLFYNVGDLITLRNFAEESGQKMINNEKLDRMQEYAESQVCRRRILLNYFGETMDHDCHNCDICGNPPARFDGTQLVQKALSAIVRTDEQEGFHMIIDILRGSSVYDLIQKGYNGLKTWGCGREVSFKDWQDYMLQMLHLGFSEIDYKDNSHLKVTDLGREVLYGRRQAELAVISHEDFSVKGRRQKLQLEMAAHASGPGVEDAQLFEKLREVRAQIASEMSVPPYIICGDKSLHEMAQIVPVRLSDIASVSGIGKHKQEQFGLRFVQAIREYKQLSTDVNEPWGKLEYDPSPLMPAARKPHDYITIKGVVYPIDLSILESIKWRAAIDHLEKDIYYNLWKECVMPVSRYVPDGVAHYEAVVKRFLEIAVEAHAITVSPDKQQIVIPVRIEYDAEGKPVQDLACSSFEDGLAQFKAFIEQHQHFPFTGGDAYECSVRRWYQSVQREVIPCSIQQRASFDAVVESFSHLPKIRKKEE